MSIQQWEPSGGGIVSAQDNALGRLADWAQSADAAYQVAERLCQSSFVPAQFRNKPVELTAAILAGSEVGLLPMAAMKSFDVIGGVAAPRAQTLRAVTLAAGHEIVLVESTVTRCTMKGRRRGSSDWQSVTWSIDRAKMLGLLAKDQWKKQPQAMLVARATSEIARLIASDAILGIGYSIEELADGDDVATPTSVAAGQGAPSSGKRTMRRPVAMEAAPVEVVAEVVEPPEIEPEIEPEVVKESPVLNTSSKLAKAMYASINDLGISDNERLPFIASVIGRQIESTKDMTDTEARTVLAHIDAINESESAS